MSYQQSQLVTEYIDGFNGETKKRLHEIRKAIQRIFPTTIEDICYGMPTYRPAPAKRGIVHFAASANHIGLYAVFDPADNPILHDKLRLHRTGKGTLQFKNDQPFPIDLIEDVLIYHASHFN